MSDLSDEQIAEQLAAFMGWQRTFDGWLTPQGWRGFDQWNPVESVEQAFAVQAEIDRHGWRRSYVMHLGEITAQPAEVQWPLWWVINATARQRCLAAIAVIGGGK